MVVELKLGAIPQVALLACSFPPTKAQRHRNSVLTHTRTYLHTQTAECHIFIFNVGRRHLEILTNIKKVCPGP